MSLDIRYLEDIDIADIKVYEVTASGNTLNECAIELGVYFFMLTICFFIMTDQVRGKPKNIGNWISFRFIQIKILEQGDEINNGNIQSFLYAASLLYMVMPFACLIGWFALMLYDKIQEEKSLWAPFCILAVGSGTLLFGYNALRIKLTNYRVKMINMVCLLITLLLVTGYQCMVVFGYESVQKFFPYSALFLNMNVTLISILVYFSKYQGVQDVGYIIKMFFPLKGIEPDRERNVNML